MASHRQRFVGLFCLLALLIWPSNAIVRECGRSSPRLARRIVGGEQSEECEFPWLVVVSENGKDICGGTLVDRTHVVTAAHCLEETDSEKSLITIRAGSSDVRNLKTFDVLSWKIHAGRDRETYAFDTAVITLAEPVKYDRCLSPICLPAPSTAPLTYKECYAAGWGKVTADEDLQPIKQKKVRLPLLDNQTCRLVYHEIIDPAKFCAGDFIRGGIDTCQGDSGGPLMCLVDEDHYVLAGITSFGWGCAEAFQPGVYSNVAHPSNWKFIADCLKEEKS